MLPTFTVGSSSERRFLRNELLAENHLIQTIGISRFAAKFRNISKSGVVCSFIKYYNNLADRIGCQDDLELMNQSIRFYESEVVCDEPRHVR